MFYYRGNLLKSGRLVPNIVKDSSPNNNNSQVTLGNKDQFNLGKPNLSPYSL